MIITLPSDSHIHHIPFLFPSHVRIPSHYTSHLLHTLFKNQKLLHVLISCKLFYNFDVFLKKNKKEGKKKEKKQEKERNNDVGYFSMIVCMNMMV